MVKLKSVDALRTGTPPDRPQRYPQTKDISNLSRRT
jgi:hypothetical protein